MPVVCVVPKPLEPRALVALPSIKAMSGRAERRAAERAGRVEENVALIEMVRGHRCIWDAQDRQHANKTTVEQACNNVAVSTRSHVCCACARACPTCKTLSAAPRMQETCWFWRLFSSVEFFFNTRPGPFGSVLTLSLFM